MLKVELHTHTADDLVDRIPYTTFELIDRAIELPELDVQARQRQAMNRAVRRRLRRFGTAQIKLRQIVPTLALPI